MKRSLLLPLCLLAIALAVFFAGFSDYTVHRNVIVHATIDKVAAQFTDANKWLYWHPDLAHQTATPSVINGSKEKQIALQNLTYFIKQINPAEIRFYKIRNNDTTTATMVAFPYKDGSYTYVGYAAEENGFTWLMRKISNTSPADDALHSLQSFVEDESRQYGFHIQTVPVSDTLILTTGTVTVKDSIISTVPVLYRLLMGYCRQHSLVPSKNYYYTSTSGLLDGRVELSVGIPASKQAGIPQAGFTFLKLPAGGRLVAGEYKGRYSGKQQLYSAMDEYVKDKHMKKVAQPLEQYNHTDMAFIDSTTVFMRLFYPVF